MSCIEEQDVLDAIIGALKEDVGSRDITTEIFIPKKRFIQGVIIAKESCIVSGLAVAARVFKAQDKLVKFKPLVRDGDFVAKGKVLAKAIGRARSILTAERVALNFLSHLCGISTKTRAFVNAVRPYKAKIMDTRKTTPGLRLLEKYAVRMGGGFNHRLTLDEMLLIKDNHLKVIGGIEKLTGFTRKYSVEIEVKNLKEFREALRLGPDIIMLDNMIIENIKKAVQLRNSLLRKSALLKPLLEVSGGINLKNVLKVASCGVEIISVGALTHSVKSIDLSLEIS